MKRIMKGILIAVGCLLSPLLVVLSTPPFLFGLGCGSNNNTGGCGNSSDRPENICCGLDLPAHTIISHDDNFDDKSASWDCVEYEIRFNEADVAKMERRMLEQCKTDDCWKLKDNTIIFSSISKRNDMGYMEDDNIYFIHELGTNSAKVRCEGERFI